MANKDKKNKTSFDVGNKAAEKWTLSETTILFDKAIDLSKKAITLTDIAIELDLYPNIFDYLVEKFPEFISKKKEILKLIENNTYKGALNGDFVPSVAIFGLKNNHGWKDRTETDITTNGKEINSPQTINYNHFNDND